MSAPRLRVLFIVSQPTVTPAISVHATLMRFLDPDRVEVHVVYNREAEAERHLAAGTSVLHRFPRAPNVRLIPAEFGPGGDLPRADRLAAGARSLPGALRDMGRLVRYIRRHRIDVIHCEYWARNGPYAYLLSRLTGARCVMHFHWKYGSWMSPASRFAVHRADTIITVSDWTGAILADAGVRRERIVTVLNGIDVDAWDLATADRAPVRAQLGLAPADPLVVMVAQLVNWKRQHVLIAAFRAVADAHPAARLLLVGDEADPAGAYTGRLRRLIGELGLERHVVLAGRRRDIRQILAAADVFALPSIDDPCALAHIEAMAMALPVVAVRAGGTPELVRDGETGLLGPADDVDQLAANLNALVGDPTRRKAMGDAGRRRALTDLTARRMADEVEAVYRVTASRR